MSLESAIQNLADAINNLAARQVANPASVTESASPPSDAPRPRGRPPKAIDAPAPAPVAPAPVAPAPAAPAPAAPAPVAATGATATIKDVVAALTPVAEQKGRDAAVALLAKYGAQTVPQLKAESYAQVVADAKALLG
jgi:pyruvate dehydrogenase E2 component (dihydrolipoamide acetyltransferase)